MVQTGSPMLSKRNASRNIPLINLNDADGFPVHLSTEQQSFQNFATNQLKQRICSYFIPVHAAGPEGEPNPICGCGARLDEHEGAIRHPDPKVKWISDLHTAVKPCDSFGDIDFTGFGNRTTQSPYARIEKDTSAATLWTLLHDVWKLPPPKLVVSVTGGAKKFFMKSRLKTAFKQGLIDVASTTDAWIITGGTATGVMKYVGEALHEYQLSGMAEQKRIVSLGIASWGCIDNNHNLRSEDGQGLFPAMYSLRDCKSGVAPLDHNHSHFLLVDDGTSNKYGREIALRSRLEEFISKSSSMSSLSTENNSLQTPVILIVCEGGVNTLEQTSRATRNKIASLIVKRSGRAADVIAEAYRMTRNKHGEESNFPQNFDQEVSRLVVQLLGMDIIKDQNRIKSAINHIRQILEDRRMVTIFELDDSNCKDMDKAVLSALLKAQKSNAQSQVDLALIWNRADIARQQIFTLENRAQWQRLELEEAMMNALNAGSTDFVMLFLDNGIHLSKFLTIARLKSLYKTCLSDKERTMNCILNNLLRRIQIYDSVFGFVTVGCNRIQEDDTDQLILLNIGRVIQMLLHFKYDNPYENPKYTEDQPGPDLEAGPKNTAGFRGQSFRGSGFRAQFEVPSKELFLWSVLFDHRQLAHTFLQMSNDPLGGTLVACGMLKSLATKAAHQEEIDLSNELLQEAVYYETLACGILCTCYHMNKTLSHELLTRELHQWGSTTLFSLAESAQLMEFMRLTCCQTKLNKIWFGRMAEYTQDWKILLVIFCPIFIQLIRFREPEFTISQEDGDRKMSVPSENFKNQSTKNKVIPVTGWFKGKKKGEPTINVFNALYYFYTAPITKFYVDGSAYVAFLALFTFVVLSDMKPVGQSIKERRFEFVCELLLWLWAITLFLEEIRQILHREAKSLLYKYLNHLANFWNQVDFIMFALFMASLGLRVHESKRDTGMTASRITYSLALLLAFMRNMEAFYVFKAIGPKIIMIQKMLKDLLFFIVILAVFILSFGVAMQSLLHTDQPFSIGSLVNAVYTPYWQIFGELFIERAEGECYPDASVRMGIEAEGETGACPNVSWLVPALSAIYMMLTNVLLLNLLIAMFSYTFQTVQDNSEQVWRFYRFQAVYCYYDSPTLPAPFMIFNLMKRGLAFCWRKVNKYSPPTSSFKERLSNESNMKLSAFERAGMERYIARKQRLSFEQIDARVALAGTRLDKVVEDLEDIKEQLVTGEDSSQMIAHTGSFDSDNRGRNSIKVEPASSDERLKLIEDKVDSQSQLLRELIHILNQK